jgi:hypothetical protein
MRNLLFLLLLTIGVNAQAVNCPILHEPNSPGNYPFTIVGAGIGTPSLIRLGFAFDNVPTGTYNSLSFRPARTISGVSGQLRYSAYEIWCRSTTGLAETKYADWPCIGGVYNPPWASPPYAPNTVKVADVLTTSAGSFAVHNMTVPLNLASQFPEPFVWTLNFVTPYTHTGGCLEILVQWHAVPQGDSIEVDGHFNRIQPTASEDIRVIEEVTCEDLLNSNPFALLGISNNASIPRGYIRLRMGAGNVPSGMADWAFVGLPVTPYPITFTSNLLGTQVNCFLHTIGDFYFGQISTWYAEVPYILGAWQFNHHIVAQTIRTDSGLNLVGITPPIRFRMHRSGELENQYTDFGGRSGTGSFSLFHQTCPSIQLN